MAEPVSTNRGTPLATLLVVDDDRTIRETLRQVFSKTYECRTADRAEQALEYLEIQEYDAIITDVSMPGVGGVQILKRIKTRQLTTPVIVISGNGEEFEDLFLEMGAFAYFTKRQSPTCGGRISEIFFRLTIPVADNRQAESQGSVVISLHDS